MTRSEYGKARSTRHLSAAQEKRIARETGNKRTANSGATAFSKGDNRGKNFIIEAKTMMQPQKSFSIKKEWITKLIEEAFGSGTPYWALAFNFGGLNNPDNLYIINQDTFNLLQELLEEAEGHGADSGK